MFHGRVADQHKSHRSQICGKHSRTMQSRIVPRLWFCMRHRRLEVNIRINSVHFRKPNICANAVDVQETDFSFTKFYRIWNHFSRCRFTHGPYSRSHSLGFGDWRLSFRTEQQRATEKPSAIVKSNMHNPITIKHTNVIPTNIDNIPLNTMNSDSSAMLYVFEDNEAVIEMIIKGRSPTTRHVSRTHRVVLDWLFDRIILDPKIQIKCIDTKHQLSDMLTEENFTRDEWNNLLHVFNISHFSSTCCTTTLSLISCSEVAKRIQNKRRRKSLCPSRDQQWWVCHFSSLRHVRPPHRVRLHLKVQGCR